MRMYKKNKDLYRLMNNLMEYGEEDIRDRFSQIYIKYKDGKKYMLENLTQPFKYGKFDEDVKDTITSLLKEEVKNNKGIFFNYDEFNSYVNEDLKANGLKSVFFNKDFVLNFNNITGHIYQPRLFVVGYDGDFDEYSSQYDLIEELLDRNGDEELYKQFVFDMVKNYKQDKNISLEDIKEFDEKVEKDLKYITKRDFDIKDTHNVFWDTPQRHYILDLFEKEEEKNRIKNIQYQENEYDEY